MRQLKQRLEPVTEWTKIQIPVQVQVEYFDDGTERWAIQHRTLGTFFGASKTEALDELFNNHPLR
jgi:hypothetical protein